jgi:hypothetical protein
MQEGVFWSAAIPGPTILSVVSPAFLTSLEWPRRAVMLTVGQG